MSADVVIPPSPLVSVMAYVEVLLAVDVPGTAEILETALPDVMVKTFD